MYKLKPNQPDFECVDGPFAGRKYKAGQAYDEVPLNEKHRFEVMKDSTPSFGHPSRGEERKQKKEENNP